MNVFVKGENMINLPDVQKGRSGFPKFPIDNVGIEGLKVKMNIKSKDNKKQQVLAKISSFCSLNENLKGINMSRIGRSIYDVLSESNHAGFSDLKKFVSKLKEAHKAKYIYMKANFDYEIENYSPITKTYSPEFVNVSFENILNGEETKSFLTVSATGLSLCPCSKEMSLLKNNISVEELKLIEELPNKLKKKILLSGFGAHNQKSQIKIKLELAKNNNFYIEDIYDIIKTSSSAPTFSILKRPDEKWVTEVSYMGGFWDNGEFNKTDGGARFVEDIIRHIVDKLNVEIDKSIVDYAIKVCNQESIHSGDICATAITTAGKNLQYIDFFE